MTYKISALAAGCMLSFISVQNAQASKILSDSVLDNVTAGALTVTATASALAISTPTYPSTVFTHVDTFTNTKIATGNAIAFSQGNITADATTNVTVSGGTISNSFTRSITLGSGAMLSLSHGITIAN